MQKWFFILAFLFILNTKMMSQSDILFQKSDLNTIIRYADDESLNAAKILKENLDKISPAHFEITSKKLDKGIILEIIKNTESNYFEINSNTKTITIRGTSSLFLEYGVYSLLEFWEVRKFTPDYTYYPKFDVLQFPKNKKIKEKPSFDFRGLLYPASYDEAFRKWHKLDWHLDDFGLWGHTFDKLLPAKEFFKENPKMFALYNHERRGESICYSNDTVFKIMQKNIIKAINEKPSATYFSVSQNDDVIFCECANCQKLNQKYGSPQGAHYFFLNKIAKQFPNTKIVTLAYLYTYHPPENLKMETNLYPILCPIEANRGEALNEGRNKAIKNVLEKWASLSKNVMLWDYTVEFSNFVSPFPNLHTFAPNYSFFENAGVKGIFAQGYADVNGSFYELRQYLLAKLLWNSKIDIPKTTADFIRGYYGKAAPYIQEYLNTLIKNQITKKDYLDIYSNPVAQRNSFLKPEDIATYDVLLTKANASNSDEIIKKRIEKLRLDLEFVFFEQAKFYGKEKHGMYIETNGKTVVKPNLENRVEDFTKKCTNFGIYELSEGGLSPSQYLEQWQFIAKNNVVDHLGENLNISFETQPSSEFNGKKEKGLNDGVKGYKDFNINWTGWYNQNAEIIIETNKLDFSSLSFQCLEDQRHWIFFPSSITIEVYENNKWIAIETLKNEELTENYHINIQNYNFNNNTFRNFDKVKITLFKLKSTPSWRERKNKKPMLMVDEIILQN